MYRGSRKRVVSWGTGRRYRATAVVPALVLGSVLATMAFGSAAAASSHRVTVQLKRPPATCGPAPARARRPVGRTPQARRQALRIRRYRACLRRARPASATTYTEATVEKPFAFSEPSCVPAEQVVLNGTMRHRFKITVDSNGGIHIEDTFTLHGQGSGYDVDPLTALLAPVSSYTASDQQIHETNFNGAFENTSVFRTIVNRLKDTVANDDLRLASEVHTTVNANYVFTAEFQRERLECR